MPSWSSYRAYGGYCSPPSWLTVKVLLQRARRDCSRQRAKYREDLKRRLTHGVEASRVERLRDVIAIGSASFSRRIRTTVAEDADGLAQKRALRQSVRVEEVRSVVETLRGERWERFAPRRGDWGRALYLWGVRNRCGLRWRLQYPGVERSAARNCLNPILQAENRG
jgi:hypothetical protein